MAALAVAGHLSAVAPGRRDRVGRGRLQVVWPTTPAGMSAATSSCRRGSVHLPGRRPGRRPA